MQPDGTSTLIGTINAVAEANFDVRRYPFDKQRLEAVFELIGFDSSEVVFELDRNSADSSWRELQISQWHLLNVSTSTGEQTAPYLGTRGSSSTFIVAMDLQRELFYVRRLVVIPLILIVVLSWSVFWMEHSSLGDRINLSFVGILTAVAYQLVISDILPHMSYFTLMTGFLNLSFFVMCATVVMSLVVDACDKKGKPELGDLIDFRCRWIFPLVYFGLLFIGTAVALTFF